MKLSFRILGIGARDGYLSELLSNQFECLTTLGLERPAFNIPKAQTMCGDVTYIDYPDNYFDLAFCAEILVHYTDEKVRNGL